MKRILLPITLATLLLSSCTPTQPSSSTGNISVGASGVSIDDASGTSLRVGTGGVGISSSGSDIRVYSGGVSIRQGNIGVSVSETGGVTLSSGTSTTQMTQAEKQAMADIDAVVNNMMSSGASNSADISVRDPLILVSPLIDAMSRAVSTKDFM